MVCIVQDSKRKYCIILTLTTVFRMNVSGYNLLIKRSNDALYKGSATAALNIKEIFPGRIHNFLSYRYPYKSKSRILHKYI
ncbi:hypothetical protein GDO81_029134 [Engystomops pustulosus]|uniref:Ribosomal protein L14 n=1 Tax=Engystomops pustulosus TaxID=76066 RepID=A0AAV6Z2B4_ENGPU|nr:hypothetical protein GDO81_029134 [Engystomops pustulosus]